MCKIGDVILVYNAKNENRYIGPHQFIVLEDTAGVVRGLDYDIISVVLSSINSENKQHKYEKYPANISILPEDRTDNRDNKTKAFAKMDQLFYFDLNKLSYKVIGTINPDIMEILVEFVEELKQKGIKFYQITDNLDASTPTGNGDDAPDSEDWTGKDEP